MKTIKFLSLLMFVALSAGFASCKDNAPQEYPFFSMGEFTVNKDVIGEGQAFELSCPYEQGLFGMPRIYYSTDGREMKELRSVEGTFEVRNFDRLNGYCKVQYMLIDRKLLKIHINGIEKGEHVIEFTVMGYNFETSTEEVIAKRTIKVNVVESDVRSSFWGESLEDTRKSVNLELVNGKYITTDDYLFYGDYTPYPGPLESYYQYTDNKLTGVVEVHKLFENSIFSPFLTERFFRKVSLIKERTSYNQDVKFGFYLKPGGQIEEKYQDALDRLILLPPEQYESRDLIILGNAILSGNIGLKYTAKSDKTLFEYIMVQNDEDEGVSDKTYYSPLS